MMMTNDWIIEAEQRAAGINYTWGSGQLGLSKKGRREGRATKVSAKSCGEHELPQNQSHI